MISNLNGCNMQLKQSFIRLNMENFIVAISNYPAIQLFQTVCHQEDSITAFLVSFVSIMSFLSHLFENHKHGMSGMKLEWLGINYRSSVEVSYFLNRCDVLGVIILGIRFIFLYYNEYGVDINPLFINTISDKSYIALLINNTNLISTGLICLSFNIISEYDKYNPKLKYLYIVTHSIWHYSIFMLADIFYRYVLTS